MSDAYTLFELNNYVRQVIALNFEDPVWIVAEISQVRASRGQLYLELIQQNEEETEVIAMASAALWYKNHLFVKKKLGNLYDAILQDGVQVSIKVKVDFHERYGMKLSIVDIDPSYTIGQVELHRQQVIERLKTAGVAGLNRELGMPSLVQRLAIISSENAAGYQDFVHQLDHNNYGYAFSRHLYHVAVQGLNVEREVVAALREIEANCSDYDCVVIIRGGGSRLDLAGFDSYNIGYQISQMSLPVFTGIGHEIDNSVADYVAHTPLKTPTAVADFLIEQTMVVDAELSELMLSIRQLTSQSTQRADYELGYILQSIQAGVREQLRATGEELTYTERELANGARAMLRASGQELDYMEQVMALASPQAVLQRGYAIVRQDGQVVSSKTAYKSGKRLAITWHDGEQEV